MSRNIAVSVALVVALFAIAAPILLAIALSRQQSLDNEKDLALSYARDVMRRTDDTTDQISIGIKNLLALDTDPCSAASLSLMREIDISSSYLQAIGYTEGDQMICSSLGVHNPVLALGPVDVLTSNGVTVRYNVEFPFAQNVRFIVVEQNGFAAIVHKNLPIDATTDESNVSLGILNIDNHGIITSRGHIQPEWIDRTAEIHEVTFVDNGYVVAVVRSKKYLTVSIAALPITNLDARTQAASAILVPIGITAGILLAIAILSLTRQQLALPAVLKTALKQNEFFLAYQPIMDLQTEKWVGAEALLRWQRPNGEVVRPDLFISVAEDVHLISSITERVLELVAHEASQIFKDHPEFHIAINLSSQDLQSMQTVERLQRLSQDTKAGPGNLIIEVTERGFANTEIAREVIREIRASGMRVAIDDFGTGYSSLSYLENFEIDFLKIDKSFVDTLGTTAPTSRVALHIIEMAKTLNLEMIAEGVELETQVNFLREHAVRFAQGWLFCKPVPFADIMAYLSNQDTLTD